MFKTPSFYLFMSTLILGVLMVISSLSWFGVWVGLEMNLLSFIPLMVLQESKKGIEASLKYFLIQACSSLLIFQSGVILSASELFLSWVMVAALTMKIGGAPFHFWFPSVAEKLKWKNVSILMTVQKLAPLVLLSYTMSKVLYLSMSISLISGLVGSLGGINEFNLRKLMSFSSIHHMGWLFLSILVKSVWFIYFLFYSFLTLTLIFLLHKNEIYHFLQMAKSSNSPWKDLSISLSFLSLGGLPPFLGFYPKWLVIQSVVTFSQIILVMILLSFSLISLFYYVRVGLSTFSFTKMKISPFFWGVQSWSENFIMSINLMGLSWISLFWSFSFLI